ncbi:MAG: AMP-binding protein [Porticoccaceae bacterium]
MRVQDAVKQAQKKLGLSLKQPDLPAQSLLELWNQSVTDANQSPAFTCLGQTLSYGEVDQLSRRVASYFQKQLKLVPGDRIAVQLPNLIQYPVVVIAAWKLGLVVVNTNPMYTVRELVHQFNDANVKAVVVLDAFYDTLCEALPDTSIEHVVVTRPIDLITQPRRGLLRAAMTLMGKRPSLPKGNWIAFPELLTGSSNYSVHRAKPEDITALQYTGGTTGASKGVMLTQRTMMSNIAQALDVINDDEDTIQHSTMVAPLPLYHIYAFSLCLGLLPALRGHSVLIPDPRNTAQFVSAIKNIEFDIFCGLNSLFVALMQNKDFLRLDFSRLRLTLSGGMALMESVANDWQKITGCVISEGYGMTESSPVISMNPPGHERIGYAGVPIAGTEIKVVNESGVEQDVGVIGELCVRGDQVMAGYYGREQQTAEVIVEGWLHTGDIVMVDEHGYIKIVDRLKDMIIVSGFNVYPNELEQALTLHPAVAQCAAIGVPDAKAGEVVKMFVVSTDPYLNSDHVIEFCKEHMAGYKVPKFVEFRDDLPMTNVGKVLRKDLKAEEKAKLA